MSGPNLDLIAIGDSTLDVFLLIPEATVSCEINKAQCLLCLEYAEKIPVEHVIQVPGAGNASNVAVGAHRLGLATALVSIVGKDATGKAIRAQWKRERISLEMVKDDPEHGTNYSTVLVFKGERTILVHHEPRHYALPPLPETRWIYYTSLGTGHEKLEEQLVEHLKKNQQVHLAFNPGSYQLRRGLSALTNVLQQTEVLFLNKEEAMRLLNDGERPMPNLLRHFHQLGVKQTIITDGPNGSYAYDGKDMWFCPIFPGPITERTGAGDSYATALVSGLAQSEPLSQAMRWGTANAWSVVQHIGPQAGLLKKAKLQQTLKSFNKIQSTFLSLTNFPEKSQAR